MSEHNIHSDDEIELKKETSKEISDEFKDVLKHDFIHDIELLH